MKIAKESKMPFNLSAARAVVSPRDWSAFLYFASTRDLSGCSVDEAIDWFNALRE